jgi:hypothetical protein
VHVHFSVRQNGLYQPIAGTSLEGWIVQAGGTQYEGSLQKGGTTVPVGNRVMSGGGFQAGDYVKTIDLLNMRAGYGTGYGLIADLPANAVGVVVPHAEYNGRQKLDREMAGVKVQYRPCANTIPPNSKPSWCKKF